ncbi:MAG: transglycosylase SLT domain-containing protein [Proteobacteria bacterium]|nr:transglycosylase SLT domain-containing protein [Pseudomonadota bacterium]
MGFFNVLVLSVTTFSFAQSPELRLQSFRKAIELQEQKKFAEAEKHYLNLLTEKSNLTEYIQFQYAQLLWAQQRKDDAVKYWQLVLSSGSPNPKMQMETQLSLAQHALEQRQFSKARGLLTGLEKRMRRQEGYPTVIYGLAQAERGLNNVARSCRWIKKLFTQHPQFEKIKSWGPSLVLNEFEGKPSNCSASSEDLKKRIKNLQWAGLSEKAHQEIETLKARLGADQKYEADRLEVAYLLHEGEVAKALAILNPYYEARKNDIGYLNTLASASARNGDSQVAVGSYYKVYKLNPRGKHGKKALYQSAFLSYQFQDYDGAARKFQEFMKVYPNSGLSRDARWHIAWIRYLKNDFEGAYESLRALLNTQGKGRRAQKSFPKDRVTYWMAMSLFRQGKLEQAKPLFESLAKDKLLGYYSVAAGFRLKKIEPMLPKLATTKKERVFPQQLRTIARFSTGDTLLPIESIHTTIPEENESEETLNLSPLQSTDEGSEEAAVAEGEADGENDSDSDLTVSQDSEAAADENTPVTSFANPVLVQRFERARDLMIVGLPQWATWDLWDIERRTTNREYLKTLMQEYETVDNYNRSSYIGQIFFGSQRAQYGIEGVRYLWEHTYPKAYSKFVNQYSEQFQIPSELIWGIMRAESHYKKDAMSPVGALGLMQVMPNTGNRMALMMNDKNFKPSDLLNPEPAIRIGARYLQRLMKKFENNMSLVAAGYNAGPHRVKAWLSSFGNLDNDEFVEHIPFLETRNYVKKVSSNIHIYTQLYSTNKEKLNYLAEPVAVRFTDKAPTKETWEDI